MAHQNYHTSTHLSIVICSFWLTTKLRAARICSESVKLARGLEMFTSCSGLPNASKVLKAKAESNAWFQVATPPESTPHMGRAASKR